MNKQEDESARLQRIREQQLRARDPLAKKHAAAQNLAKRHEKRIKRKVTPQSIYDNLERKWQMTLVGALIGLLLGLLAWALLFKFDWSALFLPVLLLAGIVIGRIMGAIWDWRDKI